MALTNYGELKTYVKDMFDRADVNDKVADFVAQATARLKRELVMMFDAESRTRSTLSAEWSVLPADFLMLRSLRRVDDHPIIYLAPDQLQVHVKANTTPDPKVYTIEAGHLRVWPKPTPTSSIEVELVYVAKLVDLALDADTNWVLTAHPDLYVQYTLAYAYEFLKDRDNRNYHMGLGTEIVAVLTGASRRERYPRAGMQMRVG